MATPQYNLDAFQAIEEIQRWILHDLPQDQPILDDLDNQTAFSLGAETALHKLRELTGPDPLQVDLIEFHVPEGTTETFLGVTFRAPEEK